MIGLKDLLVSNINFYCKVLNLWKKFLSTLHQSINACYPIYTSW